MKKADENCYQKNVRLAFQSIEKGLKAILEGRYYDEWKLYLEKLYHFSLSESLLVQTYKKVQLIRVKIINLVDSNPKLKNHISLVYLSKQLKIVSKQIENHCMVLHVDDSSLSIDSFFNEIRDLDLFEDFLLRYPYRFNCIEQNGEKILHQILENFVISLKKHCLKENYDCLDEVLYFNHLLQLYLKNYFKFLSFHQKRDLIEFFKKAKKEVPDISLEKKERYFYFLNPYLIAFSKAIESDLNGKESKFLYSRNSEDILYECMVNRTFSRPISKEVQFIVMNSSFKEVKEKNNAIFYTIDSEGSRILDDGVSITKKNDLYHLKICITNPLAFFPVDSILFDEAMKRTASLHVEDEHILMLPYAISHGLGSLTEGKMHPCVTLSFDIDPVYKEILSFDLKRESVYVKKNLEYSQFQLDYFEQSQDVDGILCWTFLQEVLPTLRNFYSMSDAYKFLFRKEKNPTSTNIVEAISSALDVETLMVFANTQLALMCSNNGYPIIYRNHFMSQEQKILIDSLMHSLELETDRNHYFHKLRQLKSLYPKSNYGDINFGHFGLGVSHYMHFTSPLQRASDLLNLNVLLECHFQKVDENRRNYLKERSISMASYINTKSTTLDIFSKEYRRILQKNS